MRGCVWIISEPQHASAKVAVADFLPAVDSIGNGFCSRCGEIGRCVGELVKVVGLPCLIRFSNKDAVCCSKIRKTVHLQVALVIFD